MKTRHQQRMLLGTLVLTLSLAAGLYWLAPQPPAVPPIQGAVLPTPKPLPDFTLQNHRGEKVTATSFGDGWHLVSYGFTHCPDVCPTLLADLDRFHALLDKSGHFKDLTIWFYSIDPARDSVEALANYVPWFDARFIGLRADDATQARRFEQALGMTATISGKLGEEDYQIAHGFRLYLLDAQGQLRAALAPTRNRAGQQFYEPPVLLEDYLALRRWVQEQS